MGTQRTVLSLTILFIAFSRAALGGISKIARPRVLPQAQIPLPTQALAARSSTRRQVVGLATCGYAERDPLSAVTCSRSSNCVFSTYNFPSTAAYQGCCGTDVDLECIFKTDCIDHSQSTSRIGALSCPYSAPFCQFFKYPEVDASGFGCGSTKNHDVQTILLPTKGDYDKLYARQDLQSLITTQAPLTNSACSAVSYIVDYCKFFTPGFNNIDPTDQASCLCYSSTTWVPDLFDGVVETCAEFIRTAEPSDSSLISALISLEGFCSSVGSGGAAQSSNSPITTSSTIGSTPSSVTGTSTFIGTSLSTAGSIQPTATGTNPTSSSPIQDFTRAQIIGSSVGSAVLAFIGAYALCLCWLKPGPHITVENDANERSSKTTNKSSTKVEEKVIGNDNQRAEGIEISEASHHIVRSP